MELDIAEHDWMLTADHLTSPIHAITTTGREIRRRLANADCPMDFPVLADLRGEGMTDYFASPLPSLTGEKLLATFTTRRPGGFTDAEMAAPAAPAYLGHQAGEKVLAGHIRRGDGEDMHAML